MKFPVAFNCVQIFSNHLLRFLLLSLSIRLVSDIQKHQQRLDLNICKILGMQTNVWHLNYEYDIHLFFLFKTETKHPKLLSSICHYIWKYLISCSLVFAVFGIILPPHFTYLVYFIHTQTQTDWNQFFATIHGRHTTSKLL